MGLNSQDWKLIRDKIIPNCGIETVITFGVLSGAKDIFSTLGFKNIIAIDVNDYEGADLILDLNQDIPYEYYNSSDLIINHGTIEHCFNIAKAIENTSRLCKVDGYIYNHSPLNNWTNHGFYQISPTFYRDFFDANDYERQEFYYELNNPLIKEWEHGFKTTIGMNCTEKDRFILCNIAKKTKNSEIVYPMQSRYIASMWKDKK
jgi:SAM-dependent methyltransferase